MPEFLQNFPKTMRGLIFIIAGTILLLHTLGILQQGLNYLIIIASLYMIGSGFIQIDGHIYLMKMFSGKEENKES